MQLTREIAYPSNPIASSTDQCACLDQAIEMILDRGALFPGGDQDPQLHVQ